MVPIPPRRDDDFVLTLSDREEADDVSSSEEEFLEVQPGKKSSHQGNEKKRKRGDGQQRQANGQKKPKTSRQDVQQDENKDDSVGAVMDPSFEFEIGAGPGIIEDGFDAWDTGNSSAARTDQPQKKGNKKGVDIDEVVERRRLKKAANKAGTQKKQKQSEEEFDGLESDEEGTAEERSDIDTEAIPGFGEDELFAADAFGGGADSDEESQDALENGISGNGIDVDDESEDASSDDDSAASPVAHPDDAGPDSDSDSESVDSVEDARQKAFFAPEIESSAKSSISETTSFQSFSLSRPILRGISSIGFATPTPIQAKTIPVALQGKDVVGGAQTGSGKTAAFIIPILERLLYRPRNVPTSRVAILMPTRELAVQCFNVATKLASFTDITFCQLVGGFSLREQENVLKKRPDVIIATPGRFIDHMRNSASFTVDTLEILVLDEADRMLEDGFSDELNEIFKTIPRSRQTLLFSATMTNDVDKLIRAGLNRPLRIMVDAKRSTVAGLVQEFVRLRPGKVDKRLAVLMLLCTQVYTDRVIIFFRTKKDAHRVRVVFALCGLKAVELHGSMTQEQRLSAVEAFRTSKTPFLLATDLASRGLDIKNVKIVLNYSAPQSLEIYLHRVGRTARAGMTGRSCTIASEEDRKVVKSAVKMGRTQGAKIVSRVIDSEEVDSWFKRLEALEDEIAAVLQEEKEEKQFANAEMQVTKGENLIKYQDEILARPKRTWFESEKDKKAAKAAGRAALNGAAESAATIKGGGKEKRKLSNKEKKRLDDRKMRTEGKVWKKGKGDAVAQLKSTSTSNPKPKSKAKGKANANRGKFKPRKM